MAQEQPQRGPDDVMDHFKRGLFAGEFDAPPYEFGEGRNDPNYWLHMEIEVPPCSLPPSQAALKVRPKQLYGVGRDTVASVLLTTDALPGARGDWERVFDFERQTIPLKVPTLRWWRSRSEISPSAGAKSLRPS